jgi:DNA-binding MarR family transcriptional regulator
VGDALRKRDLAARLERLYRDLWREFHRGDEDDLRQHERDLLSHLPTRGTVPLTWLSSHLLLPKSTASVLVKDLERRGYLTRRRRPDNERELAISLTPMGRRTVARYTVLNVQHLEQALSTVDDAELERALSLLEEIVSRHRASSQ